MSPFAFEIYRMAHETYRLSIRFLVREIIIIAIICVKNPRITSFLIIFYGVPADLKSAVGKGSTY